MCSGRYYREMYTSPFNFFNIWSHIMTVVGYNFSLIEMLRRVGFMHSGHIGGDGTNLAWQGNLLENQKVTDNSVTQMIRKMRACNKSVDWLVMMFINHLNWNKHLSNHINISLRAPTYFNLTIVLSHFLYEFKFLEWL